MQGNTALTDDKGRFLGYVKDAVRLMFHHYGSKATDFEVPVAIVKDEKARLIFDTVEDW